MSNSPRKTPSSRTPVPGSRPRGKPAVGFVRVGTVAEFRDAGRRVVQLGGTPVLVLWHDGRFAALDNRCPHMGFPLHQGDVHDGLLDCHWHHARFDVSCGATLDPWADDVDTFAVQLLGDDLYVDPRRRERDPKEHGLERLRRGLEDQLGLVIAKAVIELVQGDVDLVHALRVGARFGASERADGWQPGLSILAATANTLPHLETDDRERALVHALRQIASDCANSAPRRPLPGLIGSGRDAAGLRSWFRETIEVRDADGAERVLCTIFEQHGSAAALDAVAAACTDHRYTDGGHTLDYAVKCAELSEHVGVGAPCYTPALLFTSLVPQLVQMQRMEETSSWRRPVDVAALVAGATIDASQFSGIPDGRPLPDEPNVVEVLLGEDPAAAIALLTSRLSEGASPVSLADAVVTAAVHRVLWFGTANELADWDTVHHTLTFASAVAEGLRRVPSPELFRGVLDGALSVYLDRFLNVPKAHVAPWRDGPTGLAELETALVENYDSRFRPDRATQIARAFLEQGGKPARLLALLGRIIHREDAGFHDHQQIDLAWRRLSHRGPDHPTTHDALVACARWIAARFPTPRGREQTFAIARRLHHGQELHTSGT